MFQGKTFFGAFVLLCCLGLMSAGCGLFDREDGLGAQSVQKLVLNAHQCDIPSDCEGKLVPTACTEFGCVNHQCKLVPLADATVCDDGNGCTTSDTCTGGVCAGTLLDCPDDGNVCNGTEVCDPLLGACSFTAVPAEGSACDDSNACTEGDACTAGSCTGTTKSCDDSNPCTNDSCVPATGCAYENNTDPCDDNDACTGSVSGGTTDTCSGGTCVGGDSYEGCCTRDDQCLTASIADGSTLTCVTSDDCPGEEWCQSETDKDGNLVQACSPKDHVLGCTGADGSNDAGTWPEHAPLPAGTGMCTTCNDYDTANAVPGKPEGCLTDEIGKCNDGLDTDGDFLVDCQDVEDCLNSSCTATDPKPAGCAADETTFTTYAENATCQADGTCGYTAAAETEECKYGCDEVTGCLPDPCLALSCDDGDPCNGEETCADGACVPGTPVTCTGDPCNTSACVNNAGVAECPLTPVADGTECPDTDLCNGTETCLAGVCSAGTAVVCDGSDVPADFCAGDESSFTAYDAAVGSCQPDGKCAYAENVTPCDFGCDVADGGCKPDPKDVDQDGDGHSENEGDCEDNVVDNINPAVLCREVNPDSGELGDFYVFIDYKSPAEPLACLEGDNLVQVTDGSIFNGLTMHETAGDGADNDCGGKTDESSDDEDDVVNEATCVWDPSGPDGRFMVTDCAFFGLLL